MAKKSREISLAQEAAEDGTLLTMWTQTWGLKISPWYSNDKLKFSFIEKGASGKGKSFDIYMDTLKYGAACFDNWAIDLSRNRFEKEMAAEKAAGEKYPKRYSYKTGENAEKHIGIMNSTNGGYCLNASVPVINSDGKTVANYANIPISIYDLERLANDFNRTYLPRRKELDKMRVDAEQKQANDAAEWRKTHDSVSSQTNTSNEKKEKPASSTQTASEKKDVPADLPVTSVEVKTTELLSHVDKGAYFLLNAITKDNKNIKFIVPDSSTTDLGKVWSPFKKATSEKTSVDATIHYVSLKGWNKIVKIGK